MNISGFYDLGIQPSNDVDVWESLCYFNVRTVAISQHFDATISDDGKKRKSDKKDFVVPPPLTVLIPEKYKEKIFVFKRLTISLSDGSFLHKIVHSPNFKLYDIIAVAPTNHQTLQICCASSDIDLICFKPQNKPQWSISRKLYKIALQKNIFFELQYGDMVSDSTSRKNTIQVAHTYHAMGKSRNIIISSGAGVSKVLRSPYDVINFCFLLGFNEKEAKKTLTLNPKRLLTRAVFRRHRKSVINVEVDENLELNSSENNKSTIMQMEE